MLTDPELADIMGWSVYFMDRSPIGRGDGLAERVRRVAQAAAEAERAALGAPEPRQCTWTEDPDTSSWDTDCGGKHEIIDGWPSENNMRFCCYCGGMLREVAQEPDA
jgi:hypothetical protein